MAAQADTASDEIVNAIKSSINNLKSEQLDDIGRHIRELQNHQTPLLRLPRELREEIYDLVAIGEWRDCVAPTQRKFVGTGPFQFETTCKLASACRQLKVEGGNTMSRLARLGMIVERFDPATKSWRRLDDGETKSLRHISVTRLSFAQVDDARQFAERPYARTWARMGGIIHFKNSAVGLRPRVFGLGHDRN